MRSIEEAVKDIKYGNVFNKQCERICEQNIRDSRVKKNVGFEDKRR